MADTNTIREELGDFSSIICFRAVVVGIEKALGRRAAMVALRAAGRIRGAELVESLGLTGAAPDDATSALDGALGKDGTRLCGVDKLERNGPAAFTIYLRQTVCSADEPQGSDRELSFTFGAVQGAIEALYNVKLRGKQTGSVLRGQDNDIIDFVQR